MSTYTIQKGNHYADGINFQPVFGKRKAEYLVTFHESCLYDLGNSNQKDWNKLCGWGHFDHRANGVRFAWRPSGSSGSSCSMIELGAYLHISPNLVGKGKIEAYEFQKPMRIFPEQQYKLVISMKEVSVGVEYFFGVLYPNSTFYIGLLKVNRPNLNWLQKNVGTRSNFYFGGDEVAPHTMSADIKEL